MKRYRRPLNASELQAKADNRGRQVADLLDNALTLTFNVASIAAVICYAVGYDLGLTLALKAMLVSFTVGFTIVGISLLLFAGSVIRHEVGQRLRKRRRARQSNFT